MALLGRAAVPQPERVGDVGGDVEVLEELAVLEHQREAAAVGRGRPRGPAPSKATDPGRRVLEAGDGAEQRRLAAPGGAEHGDHRPGRHREVHVVDRGGRPEADGQVADVETHQKAPHRADAEPLHGEHHRRRAGREHDGRGHRHAEVLGTRVADQPVDHHRQGRAVVAREEAGRPELAERDGEGEPGRGEQRPPRHRQVDGQQHPQRAGAERRRPPGAGGRRWSGAPAPRYGPRAAAPPSPARSGSAARRLRRSSGRPVERDQEAEADGDRRDAERQHEDPVEHRGAADPRLAGRRGTRPTAPRVRAMRRRGERRP